MISLPEIADLALQPLRVPGGWNVIVNQFYELDPDEDLTDRELVHIEPNQVSNPWIDVVQFYFDSSWLWLAKRSDNKHTISLEWSPMGDRDGQFILQHHRGTPMKFSQPPRRTLTRTREGVEVQYHLDAPVTWSECPEGYLESRSRNEIVTTLNMWLKEFS